MNLFLQLLFLQSLPLWYIFQVTGFVAALRMFFTYGLESRTQITYPAPGNQEKELRIMSKSSFDEPKKVEHSPYRPPHLRKKDTSYMRQKKSQSSSDHESSTVDFTSSDSDYSDSDGSVKESETVWHSKVRVAAIVCIQVSSQILNSPHDAWVIQGVLFFFFSVIKSNGNSSLQKSMESSPYSSGWTHLQTSPLWEGARDCTWDHTC